MGDESALEPTDKYKIARASGMTTCGLYFCGFVSHVRNVYVFLTFAATIHKFYLQCKVDFIKLCAPSNFILLNIPLLACVVYAATLWLALDLD